MRPSYGRDDEPVEVVGHRAGDEFAERTGITAVGSSQGPEVAVSIAGVDDGRRVAEADQKEIEQQPTGSPVAVEERVDPFEGGVGSGEGLDRVRVGRD